MKKLLTLDAHNYDPICLICAVWLYGVLFLSLENC